MTKHARIPGEENGEAAEPREIQAAPPARLTAAQWRQGAAANLAALSSLLAEPGHPGVVRGGQPPQPNRRDTRQWRAAVGDDLAFLNHVAADVAEELSTDPNWTSFVLDMLAELTWTLGFEFRGQPAPPGWQPPDWASEQPQQQGQEAPVTGNAHDPTPDTAVRGRVSTCPDGGTCHHECGTGTCFRVACCGPLSGRYPDDAWPADVRAAYCQEEAP